LGFSVYPSQLEKRLPRPHAVKVREYVFELGAGAPFHFGGFVSPHLTQGIQQVSLHWIGDLTFD
jgi:hypothetical protein